MCMLQHVSTLAALPTGQAVKLQVLPQASDSIQNAPYQIAQARCTSWQGLLIHAPHNIQQGLLSLCTAQHIKAVRA